MLNRIAMVLAAFVVACSLATPFAHADEDKLSKQELAQLLAPIALYPDDLLTNVLTGATIRSTSSKRRGGEGTATTPSFRVQH